MTAKYELKRAAIVALRSVLIFTALLLRFTATLIDRAVLDLSTRPNRPPEPPDPTEPTDPDPDEMPHETPEDRP